MIVDQRTSEPTPRSTPPTGVIAELARLLAHEPTALAKANTQHQDDGTGHCRSCSSGAQTGHYRYPCTIRLAVDAARPA